MFRPYLLTGLLLLAWGAQNCYLYGVNTCHF